MNIIAIRKKRINNILMLIGLLFQNLFLINTNATAQSIENDQGITTTYSCNFDLQKQGIPKKLLDADQWAVDCVSEILTATGMQLNFGNKNFWFGKSEELDNAAALTSVTIKTNFMYAQRFIIYRPTFITDLEQKTSIAGRYVVLAHEIAHHLYADNFTQNANYTEKRQRESNADNFAGYLCQQLSLKNNFSLENCLKVYEIITQEVDTDTHPKRSTRIANFTNGWTTSKAYQTLSCSATNNLDKDPAQAIEEINRINPEFISAFRKQSDNETVNRKVKNEFIELTKLSKDKDLSMISFQGEKGMIINKTTKKIMAMQLPPAVSERDHDEVLNDRRAAGLAFATGMRRKEQPAPMTIDYKDLKDNNLTERNLILDSNNIIWDRYPNGKPFITGVVKK